MSLSCSEPFSSFPSHSKPQSPTWLFSLSSCLLHSGYIGLLGHTRNIFPAGNPEACFLTSFVFLTIIHSDHLLKIDTPMLLIPLSCFLCLHITYHHSHTLCIFVFCSSGNKLQGARRFFCLPCFLLTPLASKTVPSTE